MKFRSIVHYFPCDFLAFLVSRAYLDGRKTRRAERHHRGRCAQSNFIFREYAHAICRFRLETGNLRLLVAAAITFQPARVILSSQALIMLHNVAENLRPIIATWRLWLQRKIKRLGAIQKWRQSARSADLSAEESQLGRQIFYTIS